MAACIAPGSASASIRVALPRRVADAARLDMRSAVVLHSIAPDGPAAKAGLQTGDILLSLGEIATSGPDVVLRLLAAAEIGAPITRAHPARRPHRQPRRDARRCRPAKPQAGATRRAD